MGEEEEVVEEDEVDIPEVRQMEMEMGRVG